ncbi:MAG TPA: NADH-quinone oxidoreductase subunit A [Anaerolineales bacterium]|nr:NADH-quinone oxidoreductase subunit A [Anaerolineales bacterium]
MSDQWLFIAFLLPLALFMPALPIVLSRAIGPRKSNPMKDSAYECGVETVGDTWVQFKAQYYIFALVFVIFDVEAVFLFPWAAAYGQLELFAVLEGVLFILILAAGLIYAWRKGSLEWV